MGLQIEYSITIGTVAEIGSIVVGGLIFIGVMKQSMKDMERELEKMQDQITEFGKALIQIAVQTTRIDHLEQDMRDLRRGKGFIRDDKP